MLSIHSTEVEYTVRVFTGDEFGGGTDSNVFITMYGDKGDTGERKLKDSNNRNKFERKQVRDHWSGEVVFVQASASLSKWSLHGANPSTISSKHLMGYNTAVKLTQNTLLRILKIMNNYV